MTDIAILGIFAADAAFRAPRLPQMGETLLGDGFALNPGGKGSNQAVAAARAGGSVAFLSKIGTDTFGDMASTAWDDAGVIFAGDRVPDQPTGAAFIFLDSETGDNAIIVAPGAAGTISVADVDGWADTIRAARVFVCQLEQPLEAAQHALQIAREAGVRTMLNPAPATDLTDAMLRLCDIITPNETEAERLTGIAVAGLDDAERAARALIDRGVGAAVITLGERGALFHDGNRTLHIPARHAGDVVETTGAGDAFNGALAVAIAEGRKIDAALAFANACAAISVTRAGAAPSMPARSEIDALLLR